MMGTRFVMPSPGLLWDGTASGNGRDSQNLLASGGR